MSGPDGEASELGQLLATPPAGRDAAWVDRFSSAVVQADVVVAGGEPRTGPDGFPYGPVRLPVPGDSATTAFKDIIKACTDNGVGCVIVAGEQPLWVFTYGQLVALRTRAMLLPPDDLAHAGAATGQLLVAAPSQDLLPAYLRRTLARFLQAAGARRLGVLLVTQPGSRPSQSLVLDVFPEDVGSQEAFVALMRRIPWFLPAPLGLVGAWEELRGTFAPLV